MSRLRRLRGGRSLSDAAHELQALCQLACSVHDFDVEVSGRIPEGPAVLVSNHLGYIDPVVLCSLAPCSPISKQEVAAWPMIGAPLNRLNVIFVRRECPHSGARALRQALRCLQGGTSVLAFPEGTTSNGEMLPFQAGAFWLAQRANCPIVPIGLSMERQELCWVDDEGFLPHYARMLLGPAPRRIRVRVGRPLPARKYDDLLQLRAAARQSIERLRLGKA